MDVPISKTLLQDSDIQCVTEVLKSGWLVQGTKVREFESKWSKFVGCKHSIAVTSCTSAMSLCLIALGIKPGDEVLVPSFTWVSTANVVEQLGAKPVFCDIETTTFNIDCSQIESKITLKTKAIIPVHLFGLPANIEELKPLAEKFNLLVLEDAACGLGSRIDNSHVGNFGNAGCFSFHPRKSITTGEGGIVTTNNDELAELLRYHRDHGAAVSDLQRHLGSKPYLLADHIVPGLNQRMTDIQAALGSSQMNRVVQILDERRYLAKRYDNALKMIDYLETPVEPSGKTHGYQSYPCMFMSSKIEDLGVQVIHEKRNAFMDKLQRRGVSTRPATHAVHLLSYYQNKYGLQEKDFPNAHIADKCSISLPLYNGMSLEEQDYVISCVEEISP